MSANFPAKWGIYFVGSGRWTTDGKKARRGIETEKRGSFSPLQLTENQGQFFSVSKV